jgi:hypothetical protein
MGVKVSDLTTESAPASTDILVIADPTTGLAKKITVSALKTYMDGLGGGGDTTAPVIVSATAVTANTIEIVFSESVTVTTAGWSFKLNGASWTISSVTGSGNTWTFTMGSSGTSTDTILRSYSSTTGSTVDTSANELVTFTDQSVTNSIPAGGSYDSDATAFFTAAGITDTGQKDAVNGLVVALKAASIWTKMDAIYPMVGGDSTKHSYNLKAPGSYQLTYTGTLTHNANGITGDGASGYIDTNYSASTELADTSNCSFIAYNRTNANGIVLYNYGSGEGSVDLQRFSDGNIYAAYGKDQANRISTTLADASGRFIVTRESSTSLKLWKNGSQLGSTLTTLDGSNAVTDSVKLLCEWNGTSASSFQSYNIAFFALGDGLTDANVTAFDSALATFNTALSR